MNEKHTSPNRSALVFVCKYSSMLPFAIHSDTITSRSAFIVAPNSGSTFGWRRVFHAATSLQNLYKTQSVIDGHNELKAPPATHFSDPFGVVL